MKETSEKQVHPENISVGGAFMPAAPMYRPGEDIDGPLADKSCAYGAVLMRFVSFVSLEIWSTRRLPALPASEIAVKAQAG
jgi:hypothetical protein